MDTNLRIILNTGCLLIPVLINYTVGNLSELPNESHDDPMDFKMAQKHICFKFQ